MSDPENGEQFELSEEALTTWEFARTYLDLKDDEENFVTGLINAASRMAKGHIKGRALYRAEHIQISDGDGSRELFLENFPVELVESVKIDRFGMFGEGTEIEDTRCDREIGILYREAGFPSGWRNIRVAYTAGYDPVPEDIQTATCEVVLWLMTRVRANQIGIKSITGDGVNTAYELTMPTNAMRIFESYRRVG